MAVDVRRNIEIKARLAEPNLQRERAAKLADGSAERIVQEDTFFHAPHGRLKLREFGDGSAELIGYERRDGEGPRESRYTLVPTSHPAELAATLGRALGVRGVVRKVRERLLIGATRVHLDRVEGLGDFLELEVVLGPDDTAEHGERIARELMRELGVRPEDLVEAAYIDLLERK